MIYIAKAIYADNYSYAYLHHEPVDREYWFQYNMP